MATGGFARDEERGGYDLVAGFGWAILRTSQKFNCYGGKLVVKRRRGGREAEGGGLLNRYRV